MIQACPSIHTWHRDVPHSARGLIAIGGLILMLWGCGFGLWAVMAPLASAVVASGSVSPARFANIDALTSSWP
jgi:drug/metabolite transporter (DMT)-like permease